MQPPTVSGMGTREQPLWAVTGTHLSRVVLVAVRVTSVARLPSAQCQHKAIPLVNDEACARMNMLGSEASL